MGRVQTGTKESIAVFPDSGRFQALVAQGETVQPGLYLLRAKWGETEAKAASVETSPVCVTEQPTYPICNNEWVVSVGQRIFLDIDQDGRATLAEKLSEVQALDPPETRRNTDQFLRDVAAASTTVYADAGANTIVSTDGSLLHPFMRHALRSTIPLVNECTRGMQAFFASGCTNNAAAFPLIQPDLDLAPQSQHGISVVEAYQATARGPGGWELHVPIQPGRNDRSELWSLTNPSPTNVFFTRLVNLVTHETAHGFGIVCSTPFARHGAPASTLTLGAISGSFDVVLNWIEQQSLAKLEHEPYSCINRPTVYPNEWVMQALPNHWNDLQPGTSAQYDVPPPGEYPRLWLALDRKMWFSKPGEWIERIGTDHSIESFFRERVPLCSQPPTRSCR